MITQEVIHRRATQAALAIVFLTVALVTVVTLTGGGARYVPETEAVASADLLFADEADGVVAVFDATTGARLIEYHENEGVFVRSVMRSVARQRRMRGEGADIPVQLSRHADETLWLSDPVSGAQFYLGAFGPDNAAAFAELLALEEQRLTAQNQDTRP